MTESSRGAIVSRHAPGSRFHVFAVAERECQGLIEKGLPLPAYERVLQASHAFNMLDARSAIGVTERQAYILRVRTLARLCAEAYYAARQKLGFPMLQAA